MKQIVMSIMVTMVVGQSCRESTADGFTWRQLPQLTDPVGFAGAFSGVSNGYLLVAGGSNFPEGTRPWSGGTKCWSDKVFALKKGSTQWKEIGKLPRAMGYGVSLTWKDRMVWLGGADQTQHYRDAYLVSYDGDRLVIDTLPGLPEANANACGALIGDVIYVAGGLDSPTAPQAKRAFWSLDLAQPAGARQWEVLETWPGQPRMLGVAGAVDGAFYLISGVSLEIAAGDPLPGRDYLTDAFRYLPGGGWEKLSNLPNAVAAAPSPAYADGAGDLMVFGGDDGSLAEQNSMLKDSHPGFTTTVLAYDVATDQWQTAGTLPVDKQPDAEQNPNASTWAPVTTPSVVWDGEVILPLGEARPGVRTNRILAAKPIKK